MRTTLANDIYKYKHCSLKLGLSGAQGSYHCMLSGGSNIRNLISIRGEVVSMFQTSNTLVTMEHPYHYTKTHPLLTLKFKDLEILKFKRKKTIKLDTKHKRID